jgi:hypothetical protein
MSGTSEHVHVRTRDELRQEIRLRRKADRIGLDLIVECPDCGNPFVRAPKYRIVPKNSPGPAVDDPDDDRWLTLDEVPLWLDTLQHWPEARPFAATIRRSRGLGIPASTEPWTKLLLRRVKGHTRRMRWCMACNKRFDECRHGKTS